MLFVKPIDEEGLVRERDCGWLKTDPKIGITLTTKEAMIFTEKAEGHGSYSDWKKFFEQDHPDWKICPPVYLDQIQD